MLAGPLVPYERLYPHTHRVLDNVSLHPISHSLSSKDDKLASGLKRAGYRLGFVGKWHVSETESPLDFGFEDYHSLGDYMTWRKGLWDSDAGYLLGLSHAILREGSRRRRNVAPGLDL